MPKTSSKPALSPTDQLLWDLSDSLSMLDALDRVRASIEASKLDQAQLTFWTIMSSAEEVDPAFEVVASSHDAHISRRDIGPASLLRIRVEGHDPFVVAVWPQKDQVVHLVSTVPASDGRWQRVERWVSNSHQLTSCYLNEDEFLAVGDALGRVGRVEVSKLTWREGLQSHAIGYRANRPSLSEAVNGDVPGLGQVRTALMRSGDLSIHLRRLAGATFYGGDLRSFGELVLARLERSAADRAALLRNRQRAVGFVPRALSVRLPEPVLRSPDDTGEVLRILSADSRLAVAVVHRNPYLHLAVTDYSDGSNFDVFVTAADEVAVHAGFKSSPAALNRVLQRLTDHLQANAVVERPEVGGASKQDLLVAH